MKRYSLLIATIACTLFARSLTAQCAPPGEFIGAGGGYEWIANGQPKSTSCWDISGNVSLVTISNCGWTTKAFDMHYGARVSQQFTVPSDMTQTTWGLSYLLTFQDPNDDAWWNRLKASVIDLTTGHQVVTQTYWGNDPDITCTRRDLIFTGNLAGHTLKVVFADGSAYPDTIVRVHSISLIQR